MPCCRGILLALALVSAWAGVARGASAPVLEHLFPVALQRGTTNRVTGVGTFDGWPVGVWVDAPGITFRCETNSGRFSVELAPDAPAGPHLVRAYNDRGASVSRFLIVTPGPQVTEVEPNDDFRRPQQIESLPASINGRLEKSGDVDSYGVTLAAGQTLIASLEAYVIASPVDAVLRVLDSRGIQVALNNDDGRTFDPFIAFTPKSAGRYVVQAFGFPYPAGSDVRFAGGPALVYRLHLSGGPWARHTVPLGVSRRGETRLRVIGWNFPSGAPLERRVPGDASGPGDLLLLGGPPFSNPIELPLGEGPELLEPEGPGPLAVPVPGAVTGRISQAGEEDRYTFEAKKGKPLLLRVDSASLGFPVDAWLKVENARRQELARSDDGANADPSLEWTPPEDGTYGVVVGSVVHRGGPDHWYRLRLDAPAPSVRATVGAGEFLLKAGETNEVVVSVSRRHGHVAPLKLLPRGLPAGLLGIEGVEVPVAGGDVKLRWVAPKEAPAFSGEIRIDLVTGTGEVVGHVRQDLVTSGSNNGVPNGHSRLVTEFVERFWMTLIPSP
ncbi:MAG TPA: hypothetical protein DCM86_10305, partial [Verrucomicrobiales bacterium]|nr:hypothetical protein [Verrucomicrobiales bacterium]